MATPSSPLQPPTYLGMVICDNVVQDQETKKYYLLGTVSVTYATAFPARQDRLCVYAVLTDLRGQMNVQLRLVFVDSEASEDAQVMSIGGEVSAPDPLAVAELVFSLRNLVFPKPGEYRFQLFSADALLGERKFVVQRVPPTT